jgi:hypothetical protein
VLEVMGSYTFIACDTEKLNFSVEIFMPECTVINSGESLSIVAEGLML